MKMLENLPIPGFVSDPAWGNRWNVGENQTVSAYLDDAGNLTMTKSAKFTLHCVLNAESGDLNRLRHGRGVSLNGRSAYTVSLSAESADRVRAQLVIHEFDTNGTRLARAVVENLDRVLYVPSPAATSLGISVRTKGRGSFTIRGLEFNPTEVVKDEPGVHKYGQSLDPEADSTHRRRSDLEWVLTIRKSLYDRTPLEVLFSRKEAVEAASSLIDRGHMLEAKAVVQELNLYGDISSHSLRRTYWHGQRTGYLVHALSSLDELVAREPSDKLLHSREFLSSEYEFHRNPWAPLETFPEKYLYCSQGPILHMVGKAMPERQTGYTVRTKYTTEALQAAGEKCVIAVQAGGNHDDGLEEEVRHTVAGVPTVLFAGPSKHSLLRDEWMNVNARALYDLVEQTRPSVIHAHSDFINGVLATHVGELTGVPVVYESRGFWEETWLSRLSKVQNWENVDLVMRLYGMPELYDLRRQAERRVRERADRVVTLAETMREFILAESPQGAIDPRRVSIATNAVDPEEFPLPQGPSRVREELAIPEGHSVVGYISSIVEYEGIETLIDGFHILNDVNPNSHLMIVGDGPHLNHLRQYVESKGASNVIFTGKVAHDDILMYYHAIDVFVVPRRSTRVTELVTPLKPFEAFATGRAVVLSDVRALAEIAQDAGSAARTFRADDPTSLAEALMELTSNAPLRQKMGEEGANWVRRTRSWNSNVPQYRAIYRELKESRSDTGRVP